ncbi:MAG: LPXTG cell wall anchor domain-containing protein, partial [Protaetiibacter sp.]
NERVVIDFSCDDDASGVATCEGSTPDGELLPTGTPGTHELRIVVTDVAGHRTERIVTYTVDAAQGGGSNGGVVRPGAQGGLASTGVQDVVPAIALAMLLLGAGAALVIRRRVRTR